MPDRPTDLPTLEARPEDAHKGHFGRALIVGGSRGMTGAAALAGMATLRTGAGLVTIATSDVCLDIVASFDPCYMTIPLPCDKVGRPTAAAANVIIERAKGMSCLAVGPGLGRSDDVTAIVTRLYEAMPKPLVLDADALNALSTRERPLAGAAGPRVLTPHIGEFRRLTHEPELSLEAGYENAERLAAEFGVVILLKSHRSLITDGKRSTHNTTGNPGMATGGSGDVLTGVITALLCQGLEPYEAAQLGAHVHGLAGDYAAAEIGEPSMLPTDMLRFLPKAVQDVVE